MLNILFSFYLYITNFHVAKTIPPPIPINYSGFFWGSLTQDPYFKDILAKCRGFLQI